MITTTPDRTVTDEFERSISEHANAMLRMYGNAIPARGAGAYFEIYAEQEADRLAQQTRCSFCHELYPRHAMSNINAGTNSGPRWKCVTCLWGAEGN